MSSAENGKPAGRLVWISEATYNGLEDLRWADHRSSQAAARVGDDWEDAPADPEAAIQQALLSDGRLANIPPSAVLHALGVPSSSPTRSDNP